ncbi:MAG: hypothetical protein ACE5OR_07880 [bacterium]
MRKLTVIFGLLILCFLATIFLGLGRSKENLCPIGLSGKISQPEDSGANLSAVKRKVHGYVKNWGQPNAGAYMKLFVDWDTPMTMAVLCGGRISVLNVDRGREGGIDGCEKNKSQGAVDGNISSPCTNPKHQKGESLKYEKRCFNLHTAFELKFCRLWAASSERGTYWPGVVWPSQLSFCPR